MIWQYSSFKYYTWCSEKNDFLVPEGPSIKLGPEIIKKMNSLSRQLKEKMDNCLEVAKSSEKFQNCHYDIALLLLNLLFQGTMNPSKNFTVKRS